MTADVFEAYARLRRALSECPPPVEDELEPYVVLVRVEDLRALLDVPLKHAGQMKVAGAAIEAFNARVSLSKKVGVPLAKSDRKALRAALRVLLGATPGDLVKAESEEESDEA